MLGSTLAICGLLAGAGCGPPGPRALLQGERLIKEGKYDEAQAKLKVATTLIPQNAQAWNHLGMAYHGSRMYLEAAAAYEQALKLNRDLAVAHFNPGNLLLDTGNPTAAQQHLTTFTLMQPRMADGWLKLGVAQTQLRQSGMAKMSLDQALSLNATNADTWNTMGLVMMQQNRPREAMSCYENALKYQTNHGPALLNEAIVLHQYLKNRPLALQKYREYLVKNPSAPDFASVQTIALQLDAELQPSKPLQANIIGPITTRTNPAAAAQSAPVRAMPSNAIVPSVTLASTTRSNATPQQPRQTVDNLTAPNRAEPTAATNAGPLSITLAANREIPKLASPVTNLVSVPPTNRILSTEKHIKAVEAAVSTNLLASPETNLVSSIATNRTVFAEKHLKAVEKAVSTNLLASSAAAVQAEAKLNESAAHPIEDVTRLETEPPIILPGEEDPATAIDDATKTEPVSPDVSATNAVASAPQSLVVRMPAPEKRSFFQKANPASWFRPKSKETAPPLAKASEASVQKTDDAAVAAEPVKQPAAIAPVIARYPYRNPAKPVPGDVNGAKKAMDQAYKDLRSARWSQAMDGFKKAVASDPACFEAHYRLGWAAFQSASVPEALLEYENALAINPALVDARFNFAVALQKANYHRDAASELEKLQSLAPKDARVQLFLANVYAQQLRVPQQARTHYLRVLELEPNHAEASAIRYWLAANP